MNNKKKALIVDDEAHIVKVVKDRLEADGLNIITANSGEEALKKVSERPDIIILDILMPDINGLEVLRRLKASDATKNIPVIILTVKGDNTTEKKSMDLGAAEFIEKPFSLVGLSEAVKKILNRI